MSAKMVEVVCNLNQVRSPFLAAFLAMHFHEIAFSSSGVNVKKNAKNDFRAAQIAMQWGFAYQIMDSQSISNSINLNDKRIISVDDSVRASLSSRFEHIQLLPKFLGPNFSKLMEPIDPINCNLPDLRFELAKLLRFGVLQMSSFSMLEETANITAIIPNTSHKFEDVYRHLLPRVATGKLTIIDGSLKKPSFSNTLYPKFEVRQPLSSLEPGVIYSSQFEVLETEKLLCSIEWKEWLFDLSYGGPVIIVTPPMEDFAQHKICDSFLASIWSGGCVDDLK